MKTTSGRLCRWSMELQPYKYTVIDKDGTKHGNADALSRREYPADSTEVSVQNRNEIPEVGMMEAEGKQEYHLQYQNYPVIGQYEGHPLNTLEAIQQAELAYLHIDPVDYILEITAVTKSVSEYQQEDSFLGPIYNFLKDNENLPDNRREAR